MKIATWNVNGVRKRQEEVAQWVGAHTPDVVCLQEIKALPEQIPPSLRALDQYWAAWHGHKGYSGVALLLRKETFPDEPRFEHPPFDYETRIVTAEAGGHLFASTYVPNGGKDFPAKMNYLREMSQWIASLRAEKRSVVVCGDLNVARSEMDVHPTERAVMVGQLPQERAYIESILSNRLVDLVRSTHPDDDRLFTWWAPWRNMRQRNIGWRLDYVVVTDDLAERATSCEVQKGFGTSDHAPVIAHFDP